MEKVWCFFGFHRYKLEQDGPVTHNGRTVGIWTFRTCSVCGKGKYKQHC